MSEKHAWLKLIAFTIGVVAVVSSISANFAWSWFVAERDVNIVMGAPTSYSNAVGQELDEWLKLNDVSSSVSVNEDTLSAVADVNNAGDEIADPEAINVGFVAQRINADQFPYVDSLGTIASQPLLIFARAELGNKLTLTDLANKEVSIGVPGSDVNQLMVEIFDKIGFSETVDIRNDPTSVGVEQLLAGEIDALALLTSLGTPLVGELAIDPDLVIVNLDRSSALAFQLDFAQPATIPPSFINYARGIPVEPITTVAVELTVIASQFLDEPNVLLIAQQLSILDPRMRLPTDKSEKEAYPTFKNTQFPVSEIARDYYRDGAPWHYQVFPPTLISYVWVPISRLIAVTLLILLVFRYLVPQLRKLRYRSIGAELALELRLSHLERRHREGKPLNERQVRELERLVARIDAPKPDPDKKIKERALLLLGHQDEVVASE